MCEAARNLSIRGSIWTTAVIFVLLSVAGCGQAAEAPENVLSGNALEAENQGEPAPVVSAPLPPVDRAELLAAAAAAADATAANRPLPHQNGELIDRSFVLRLPFGCTGPMKEPAKEWAGWSQDPKTGSLKLTATNQFVQRPAWLDAIVGDQQVDAMEGFWIERPWTTSEDCPRATATDMDENDSAPARQTVGIAQFFTSEAPRTLQRGARPYTITVKSDVRPASASPNYRLVLSGRITGFADRQPVHCWNEAPDLPPVCLVAVEISRVAFENAADGSVLSEWRR